MLEDFAGKFELSLFGQDYESFMKYLNLHEFIFADAEVVPRFRPKKDERVPYKLKINSMTELGNVCSSMLSAVVISVNSARLSPSFRKQLLKIIKENKGDTPLKLLLIDEPSGYKVEFKVKKYCVTVSSVFKDSLEAIGVGCTLLRK